MKSARTAIGIDLGTTFSLAAILCEGAPRVLNNSLGQPLTPSAVSVDESGRVLVGEAARARLATDPENTVTAFKRSMGTSDRFLLRGRAFSPEELSALVLRTIREDAEAALGRPVDEAVVTVPAYFGELQRRATKDSCEIAGLHVERIVNEPTAAALAFGMHDKERQSRVMVVDLGGGTFDVTVLEIVDGVIEIQATAGDARLGGEDFTDALRDVLEDRIQSTHGSPTAPGSGAARLRAAAESAKLSLTAGQVAAVRLLGVPLMSGAEIDMETTLTVDVALSVWRGLLARIEGPIRRALRDASASPTALDEVLLVGGATRMPAFREYVRKLFGAKLSFGLPPDEAVALGAAVQAALKAGDEAVADLVATDIAPFTLGVETVVEAGTTLVQGAFLPVIDRGTVLPASRMRSVCTVHPQQTQIAVRVFQGEHSQCERNQLLGEYTVSGIPKAPAGRERIDIRYTYDLNGLLEVESTIVSTGKKATLMIERTPGLLHRAEVEAARLAMTRIKFHPRDALPNVTALSRAEELFVELVGGERDRLAHGIHQLRLALERQDTVEIQTARAVLNELVGSMGR